MFPRAGYYFSAILMIAVIAFWIPWYSNLLGDHSLWVNFHGTVMSLWLVLLISQAFLMKSGRRAEHRMLGKASFVVGPLCIISFPLLAYSNFPPDGTLIPTFRAYILWLQLGLGVLFAWFFVAAIWNRKDSQLHARYMIATSLTALDPIIARLVIFYGPQPETAPDVTVAPVEMQIVSYSLVVLVLIALLYFDRKQKKGLAVFQKVAAGFAIFMVLTFTLATSEGWLNFANVLAKL